MPKISNSISDSLSSSSASSLTKSLGGDVEDWIYGGGDGARSFCTGRPPLSSPFAGVARRSSDSRLRRCPDQPIAIALSQPFANSLAWPPCLIASSPDGKRQSCFISLSSYFTLLFQAAEPFFLLAGPNVIESEEHILKMAKHIKTVTSRLGLPLMFKSSFDKANRTSSKSFLGPGLEQGLKCEAVGRVADIIQIPAFL
ncbi:uncharacterized protein LOC122001038 [Zingiber officinale]|uniref:uncharacterized protein LOC122001038 n=1 Tax=Zingiber officinale TaxID=94328 RepID=UPI001C4DA953|nr:uncharacterized protein LOC122001038 [Zingiber officinale]